jgi:hypothetical protein
MSKYTVVSRVSVEIEAAGPEDALAKWASPETARNPQRNNFWIEDENGDTVYPE